MRTKKSWDGAVRIHERTLPPYDALLDPNCDLVRSPHFHQAMERDAFPAASPMLSSTSTAAWQPLEMPALEAAALRAIDVREEHLSRLHTLLMHGLEEWPEELEAQAALLASLRAQITDELYALRCVARTIPRRAPHSRSLLCPCALARAPCASHDDPDRGWCASAASPASR